MTPFELGYHRFVKEAKMDKDAIAFLAALPWILGAAAAGAGTYGAATADTSKGESRMGKALQYGSMPLYGLGPAGMVGGMAAGAAGQHLSGGTQQAYMQQQQNVQNQKYKQHQQKQQQYASAPDAQRREGMGLAWGKSLANRAQPAQPAQPAQTKRPAQTAQTTRPPQPAQTAAAPTTVT